MDHNTLSECLHSITTLRSLLDDKQVEKMNQALFEVELAYTLPHGSVYARKCELYPSEAGSAYESRQELIGKLIALGSPKPAPYALFVQNFISEVKSHIPKLEAKDQPRFDRFVFHLEAELKIFAAVKFYTTNEEGKEYTEKNDPEGMIAERCFRDAVDKYIKPLIKLVRSPADEEDLVRRNLQLQQVVDICAKDLDWDKLLALHDEFQDEGRADMLSSLCHQLVCELQQLRFGSPVPALLDALKFKLPTVEIPAPPGPAPPVVETTTKKKKKPQAKTAAPASTQPPPPHEQEEYVPPADVYEMEDQTPPSPPPFAKKTQQEAEEKEEEPEFRQTKRVKVANEAKTKTSAEPKGAKTKTSAEPKEAPTTPKKSATAAAAAPASTPPESEEAKQLWETSSVQSTKRETAVRAKFTKEEDKAIRDGVEKHGLGRWKQILMDEEFAPVFRSVKQRTAVNLKDRWRNMS